MPSRRDGRIEPGQPLRSAISAAAWNRAQDAADAVLGQRPGVTAEGPVSAMPPFWRVRLRWRASGGDTSKVLKPYHYVTIGAGGSGDDIDGGLLNAPRISLNANTAITDVPVFANPSGGEFNRYFTSEDNAAQPSYIQNRVAIALEPIRHDSIGWAAIAGVCPAKIDVSNTGYGFVIPQWRWHTDRAFGPSTLRTPKCTADNEGEWRLQANWFAGYPIVWRDNLGVADDVWAYVDLSTFWAQPFVLAKPAGDRLLLGYTSDSGDQNVVQLYIDRITPSGMYVRVTNNFADVDSNFFVWLANPFAMNPDTAGLAFGLLRAPDQWHVVAADNARQELMQLGGNAYGLRSPNGVFLPRND